MCLGETEGVQLTWVLMGRTDPADNPLPILRATGTPSLVAPFPLGSLWGREFPGGTGTALVGWGGASEWSPL